MNKSELVALMAKEAGITQDQAGKAMGALVGAIQGSLASGNDVTLIGFGTFSVVERKARTGRNPRTGEAVQLPAKKSPQFKAGKVLREAVERKE
ncbi:HU family DNA-binding protein [Candidatus Magnetaquicoccus inordinatus]|uniref:HU family DNA-binding protein n=1 Tax=Candidatus Magnetaquicoccus inordinatus TaxID=2496818 RepID=UPI00102CE3C1|nr:HU family DNA-binding protein [Candidatus Magnetaquicoccus inordinatus]